MEKEDKNQEPKEIVSLCPYRLKEKTITPNDENSKDRIGVIKQITFREFMACLRSRCEIWDGSGECCSYKRI